MAKRRKVGNLLALALLSALVEQPMYPYEMASTLRSRGKDEAVKINWGSLYTVVQNLEKHGFIEALNVARAGRQPERTTYRITDAGRAELTGWLRELLSVPEREYPTFAAALQEMANLPPDEVRTLLEERLAVLDAAVAQGQQSLDEWSQRLPRLLLVETEYQLALRRAEAEWVRGLLAELTAGTLPGMSAWREYHKTGKVPADLADLAEQAKGPVRREPDG